MSCQNLPVRNERPAPGHTPAIRPLLLGALLCAVAVLLVVGWLLAQTAGASTPDLLGFAAIVGVLLCGMVGEPGPEKRAKVERIYDASGTPSYYTVTLGGETITLEPGKAWGKADVFKWVTRGLIDAPQSYHVGPDGTVDINGEKIPLMAPNGVKRLEDEINKHFSGPSPKKPIVSAASVAAAAKAAAAPPATKVVFKVRKDHLGHPIVECWRGTERRETGLRGLMGLVANGLMIKPNAIHVDPLLRAIELDGRRFECDDAGIRELEDALNAVYAPALGDEDEAVVEIRENAASATGFDIRFVTTRAGVSAEIKGHLKQELLDLLQDQSRCDLLHPGIVIRLSPPNLLIRRKRSDGGEEPVPEIPDLHYRRANAAQVRDTLNHPLVRRSSAKAVPNAQTAGRVKPGEIELLQVSRDPQNRQVLWLEATKAGGEKLERRVFTHHNVEDLQHASVFLEHLDVLLSLDGHKLSILDQSTKQEETLGLSAESTEEDLVRAGWMLTSALKPAIARPPEPVSRQIIVPPAIVPAPAAPPPVAVVPETKALVPEPVPIPPEAGGATRSLPDAAAAAVEVSAPGTSVSPAPGIEPTEVVDSGLAALFADASALRVNEEIFRRIGPRFVLEVQDVLLSLPRVFENRRFEILNFKRQEVESVLELRAEDFFGFYLSHVSEQNEVLVYACGGRHLEWGPNRCVVQESFNAEAREYKGTALLGLAQDTSDQFVFIVDPTFRAWVKPHEKEFAAVFARFVTIAELQAQWADVNLIWPELPPEPEVSPP